MFLFTKSLISDTLYDIIEKRRSDGYEKSSRESNGAARCYSLREKKYFNHGGFAKMMQPLATEKEVDVEKLDLPTFVKLALDPTTMETLSTAYRVATKNGNAGVELEYVKI